MSVIDWKRKRTNLGSCFEIPLVWSSVVFLGAHEEMDHVVLHCYLKTGRLLSDSSETGLDGHGVAQFVPQTERDWDLR